jgi:hypothetical protein
MRNLLLAGTAGLLLSVGAIGAASAANPNVPTSSPYAIQDVGPQTQPPGYMDPGYAYDNGSGYGMVEGRSAYVDSDYDDSGYVDPGYGYYGSPAPVGGFFFGGGGGHFHGGHFGGHHFGGHRIR